MGGDNGGKGGRVFRNNYKGHMDKTKREWDQGREVAMAGVWGEWGGKCRQLYLNNNFFKKASEIQNNHILDEVLKC